MKPDFNFKQFGIRHDKCAMKVNTDGIILGAYCRVEHQGKVIDIGTGTGLIALMLAQKDPSVFIDAVDIDADAIAQAQENVANSPWPEQVNVYQADILEYAQTTNQKYDLVISNPPFFSQSLKSENQKRSLARHNDHLSFSELLLAAEQLSHQTTRLCLILPCSERERFLEALNNSVWYEKEQMLIHHHYNKAPIRFIASLSQEKSLEPIESHLVIRNEQGEYSQQYRALCRDYYLKF